MIASTETVAPPSAPFLELANGGGVLLRSPAPPKEPMPRAARSFLPSRLLMAGPQG